LAESVHPVTKDLSSRNWFRLDKPELKKKNKKKKKTKRVDEAHLAPVAKWMASMLDVEI
jgi:hypothetical protein